ncbi:type I secretion C-terminal target domain-containing protein, partial [Jannaschia sp. S6380]|uniref:type I secretion C-terminal target domain-containing protein n=1 Tax=Jannaschia sp. S6380 TaxID=2926408 RepID=UPI001FF5C005
PDTGDDDGNLSLSAPDLEIDAGEVGAVGFTLSGLDADATAVITVSDGSASVVSGTIAADGTVTLDLTALSDGPLSSSVTATDAGGNTATVAGPALDLRTQPDSSADEDGNLALSAPDLQIDSDEVGAVGFTLSGLDADATAVITVSDGSASVTSGTIAADGSVTLDLSSLADGPLTSSVTATDTTGNTATVAGPGLTLDTVTPPDPGAEVTGTLGNDTLNGIDGENTTILGLAGSDKLFGKSGDDTVIGGADGDVLRGGAGADTFVFDADAVAAPGDDLKDFNLGEGDRLEFRDILTGFDGSDLSGHLRIVAQGTVGRLEIDTDGGGDAFTALGIIRGGRNLDIQQMFLDG